MDGTAATHHDAGSTSAQLHFGKRTPVGHNRKAIDQFNERGVIAG